MKEWTPPKRGTSSSRSRPRLRGEAPFGAGLLGSLGAVSSGSPPQTPGASSTAPVQQPPLTSFIPSQGHKNPARLEIQHPDGPGAAHGLHAVQGISMHLTPMFGQEMRHPCLNPELVLLFRPAIHGFIPRQRSKRSTRNRGSPREEVQPGPKLRSTDDSSRRGFLPHDPSRI